MASGAGRSHFRLRHRKSQSDLVNTTIILAKAKEESALPLRGKKSRLKRDDLVDYFAAQRLGLRPQVIERVLREIAESLSLWPERIARAHLSETKKAAYLALLDERASRLGLSL